jgi:hypothetical protein
MKIIQTFKRNELATINIIVHQKNLFYDKNKKVTHISLNFFEKLGLFLQRLFCCRSTSKLKIKNFTKISSAELKRITQIQQQSNRQQAEVTQVVQVTQGREEPPATLEKAEEHFSNERWDMAEQVLDSLDQNNAPVQQLYAKICQAYIMASGVNQLRSIISGGMIFKKILNADLQNEVIDTLLEKAYSFQTVLDFTNQLENTDLILDIYLIVIHKNHIDKGKLGAFDILCAIAAKDNKLGEARHRLKEYLTNGGNQVEEALRCLSSS